MRRDADKHFGTVSGVEFQRMKDWDLQEENLNGVHNIMQPSAYLKDDDYRAYLRNLFSEDTKRKIKDLFPGAPHSVNRHIFVNEPFLCGQGEDKHTFILLGKWQITTS